MDLASGPYLFMMPCSWNKRLSRGMESFEEMTRPVRRMLCCGAIKRLVAVLLHQHGRILPPTSRNPTVTRHSRTRGEYLRGYGRSRTSSGRGWVSNSLGLRTVYFHMYTCKGSEGYEQAVSIQANSYSAMMRISGGVGQLP